MHTRYFITPDYMYFLAYFKRGRPSKKTNKLKNLIPAPADLEREGTMVINRESEARLAFLKLASFKVIPAK